MKTYSRAVKDDVQKRLRRIEGQVRGVQRMVDEERECEEVLQQLNAVHAAVRNTTRLFMRAYARDCLLSEDVTGRDAEAMVDELLNLMDKVR